MIAFSSSKCKADGMVTRTFWRRRIEDAWRRRSVVWLMGVRRAGKTVLGQSLPDIRYYDCELPRVRRLLEDPESFLGDIGDGGLSSTRSIACRTPPRSSSSRPTTSPT